MTLIKSSTSGGTSWSSSYGSWIYNYLYNQCLSPQILWVRIPFMGGVFDTTLCDKVCQWLATGRWFSPGTPVSSANKTDRHDITEILLKVALNSINQTKPAHPGGIEPTRSTHTTKHMYTGGSPTSLTVGVEQHSANRNLTHHTPG